MEAKENPFDPTRRSPFCSSSRVVDDDGRVGRGASHLTPRDEKMMGQFMRDAFAKKAGIEITKEQFIVLVKLDEQDGIMQKDLAFITERNKGSLARLISFCTLAP